MTRKRILGVVVGATLFVGASLSPAMAGEITGGGGSTAAPDHGKSWCLFSGLNDEFIQGDTTAPRTQSWGSFDKATREFLTGIGFHPGVACNAHLNPYSGGEPH